MASQIMNKEEHCGQWLRQRQSCIEARVAASSRETGGAAVISQEWASKLLETMNKEEGHKSIVASDCVSAKAA